MCYQAQTIARLGNIIHTLPSKREPTSDTRSNHPLCCRALSHHQSDSQQSRRFPPSTAATPFRDSEKVGAYICGCIAAAWCATRLVKSKNLHRHIASPPVSNSVTPAIPIPCLLFSSVSHWPPPPITPVLPWQITEVPSAIYNCALLRRIAPYSCLACTLPSKIYLTPPSQKLPTGGPPSAYTGWFRFSCSRA